MYFCTLLCIVLLEKLSMTSFLYGLLGFLRIAVCCSLVTHVAERHLKEIHSVECSENNPSAKSTFPLRGGCYIAAPGLNYPFFGLQISIRGKELLYHPKFL